MDRSHFGCSGWTPGVGRPHFEYSISNDPTHKDYNTARKIKNQWKGELKSKDFAKVGEMEYIDPFVQEVINEYGENFNHQQYTEFIQRKMREQNVK